MNDTPTESMRGRHPPIIMVVDDEPANLQVIRMVVVREKFPCELVLRDSAQAALDYLENQRVDLVLLDVVMPGMNGFDMFEKMRATPEWADIPVIFLSAIQEPEYIIRGLEMGAADYIGKPLISQVLTARIKAVLRINYLQNELRDRNQELERANNLKDEFLSICSHDLRAPLSAIELTCQLWREGGGEQPETRERMFERITNQTKLARRLVESILDLSKIEEGRLVPQPTFFSLGKMLEGCREDQQPLVMAKGIEFRTEYDHGTAICFGDREMIAQTVRNILGNAIKFARRSIVLSSRAEALDGPEGGRWEMIVTDDGPGIPPEQLETIFHKYVTTDLHDAGSGLGLFIAQQTMKMHNGTISAFSVPNEATKLVVRLPLVFDPESLPDLNDFSRARVQIFAASRDTAALLEGILLEGGLVHISAESIAGDSAERILRAPPEIAVIDLQLEPQDYFPLVRLMNNGSVPTQWVFLGSPQELDELESLTRRPFLKLPSPLNPLVYLGTIKSAMEAQSEEILYGMG